MANSLPLNFFVFAAALGSGVVAGVFFAFSSFVMPALALVPVDSGIAVMNAFNITVYLPGFMFAFWGTTLACLGLIAVTILRVRGLQGWLIASGALVFLIGCVGVTGTFNVPLNDALETAPPGTETQLRNWAAVMEDWTFWNHVRTGAAFATACILTVVLMPIARSGSGGR